MKLLHLDQLADNCVWNDTYYPDEDMYLQKSGDERRVFSGAALQTAWDSSPNKGIGL